ncbi:metal-dependent hydrolase [Specibacter cremeus]|uniref:metal-dependent hydrolase n=1 Tax=Specibacter cremeus TaxID=1629051 RepID=UPI000F7B1DBC|nr:metal-dependent hydrolase [Specibacter cremeus]
MTLPRIDTLVSYPGQALSGTGTVLHVDGNVATHDGQKVVLVDATPFHPVDAGWPDQGPDTGTLSTDTDTWPVLDCVVAATDGAALHLGADIPVRKGTDGWAFVVAHLLPGDAAVTEGAAVALRVDAERRRALSLGHTGCHLASLALNRALAPRWTKETRADALGAPDFDGAAIASSTITEFGAVDVYRLNKSLRRKGFGADWLTGGGLDDGLAGLAADVNATLAEWVATGAPVRVDCDGPALTDRRYWVAGLPGGAASIPCGGTHAASLAELAGLRADFTLGEADGTMTLTMTTRCEP